MTAHTRLLRLVASREHNHGCTMKKTTIPRTKLVLRKDTTRILVDKDLAQVAAGAGDGEAGAGGKDSEVYLTCVRVVPVAQD
jgi:hypothetical protein